MLMKGQTAAALDHITAAARLSPVYTKGLLDASEALLHMGDPDAASDAVTQFEDLNGHATTDSRAAMAHVLRARKDLVGAEAIAAEVVAWNGDAHLLLLHGGILAEMGRLTEAAARYREILRIHPQDYLATYNLAYVEERAGASETAIALYRHAIALRPHFAAAEENLGYLLIREGRLKEACTHLRNATTIAPGNPSAWVGLGDALAARGKRKEATACFEQALELQPDGPHAPHARRALQRLATD